MNINDLAFEEENPFTVFDAWFRSLQEMETTDSTAMTLSTVGEDLQPHSRIVLLRNHSEDGFVFYTNYTSKKGNDLEKNPKASLLFYSHKFERQIRIQGTVSKVDPKDSDLYFSKRPRESRIGAIASKQSAKISSREDLLNRFEKLTEEFREDVPRPAYWGGYILKPNYFEYWMKRNYRLHDRVVFEKSSTQWEKYQLSP